MKHITGNPTVSKQPNSGAPVAMQVDSAAFETIIDGLKDVVARLELTNELLKEIGK